MTRTRRPASRRGPSPTDERRQSVPPPPPSPTPVPAAELAACAAELRRLVDELAELTGCGGAWGIRVLRRNIELALISPETLASPENQLDFVEELAEALWDEADGGARQVVRPGSTPEETGRREERRRAVVERLDEIAQGLCADIGAWREEPAAAR